MMCLPAEKAYDIGIQVLDVKIQDSEPPTEEVNMNEANKYRNTEIPKAQAEADRILRNAESQKQTKINEARGEVAKFLKRQGFILRQWKRYFRVLRFILKIIANILFSGMFIVTEGEYVCIRRFGKKQVNPSQ